MDIKDTRFLDPRLSVHFELFDAIHTSNTFQDCKIPCKRTDIEGRLVPQTPFEDYAGIILIFSSKVEVTRSEPLMTSLDLIATIGGVLGLTLGLGFLQLAQLLDRALSGLVVFCRENWKDCY